LDTYTELIGYTAAALTTVSFVPQVVRTWRTGGAGLSWSMLGLFGAGVTLWFIYGVLRESWPIMLANGLTDAQVLVLLGLKVRQSLRTRGARD